MPTPPSASREYRGSSAAPTLQGKRFNSEIISSMIESLICGSSGRAPRLDRVSDRQHQQEKYRMTNSEANPPPAVGAYWIKEEDYPALLQLEQGLKAYGHVVLRVYIDPTTFPDWCAAHGTSPGSAGRRKFVAAAVTERYGRQA